MSLLLALTAGTSGVSAALAWTEENDTVAISVTVSSAAVSAALAWVEQDDTFAVAVQAQGGKQGGDDAIWHKSPHTGFDLKRWKKEHELDERMEQTIRDLLHPRQVEPEEIPEAAAIAAEEAIAKAMDYTDHNTRILLLL